MAAPTEQRKVDVRVYLGILLFRWQVIVVCFLYGVLGAILYVHFVSPEYLTACKVVAYRDPLLQVTPQSSYWSSMSMHSYLLQSDRLRDRAVKRLAEAWSGRQGLGAPGRLNLPVEVRPERGVGAMLVVSVRTPRADYGEAFLSALLEEHKTEWQAIQMEASESASRLLEDELARLEEKIKSAEDNYIEYQRLNDTWRTEARSSTESRYLLALMERKSQLSTELMMLEAQSPTLKDQGVGVINDTARTLRESAAVDPVPDAVAGDEDEAKTLTKAVQTSGDRTLRAIDEMRQPKAKLPDPVEALSAGGDQGGDPLGWRDLRVKLARLRQEDQEISKNLQPEHPRLVDLRKQIRNIQDQLDLAARIELEKLKERRKTLQIAIGALEDAEYKWQAKSLLASQRQAELKRIANVVKRFEGNYATLYERLHDMRVSEELKSEHFRVVEPVKTGPKPVWPDPLKILLVGLVLGAGSGVGLAVVAQMLDNKVQTVRDVEEELGVPFLGGVPYWLHGGLESVVRPIVTEEHSSGAVEAYRALRTAVVAALAKANEKVLLVTSADSREGKTLTVLNLAVMIAQMDKKVLLVDMDMRRGRLHRSLGTDRTPGLSDALKGECPLRDAVRKTRFPGLDFLPCGRILKDAAEALQTSDLNALFGEAKESYDYVLLDTPPVLRVTDTVIAAGRGFGVVLYVTRVNSTPKPLVKYSLDMLRDARIVGMILNSIEMHRISSLYYSYQYPNYAYYSSAYAYGYSYYDEGGGGARRHRGFWDNLRQRASQWWRRTFLPTE